MIGDLGQRLSGLRLRHALFALLLGSLFAASPGFAAAEPPHPVGLKQIEFTDRDRQIALAVFYPATLSDNAAAPTGLPFYTDLHLYQDAELAEGRHPLVMLSHGRGSNPLAYAWFAQYRPPSAATSSPPSITTTSGRYLRFQPIAYLANRIWQRPRRYRARHLSSCWPTKAEKPRRSIPTRIAIAGHSQGGFTSLWIGGAKVNAEEVIRLPAPAGRTTGLVPELTCATSCRSIPLRRARCATPRVKAAFGRWRRASCRPSAWTRRGCVR